MNENSGRTIVVGDVHGCLEELKELLSVVAFEKGRDRLIFLGDLMDRGPDPVGAVRFVRELGAECLLGNHEEKHLRWRRHEVRRRANPEYVNPMTNLSTVQAQENAALSDEDIAWMAKLPRTIRLNHQFVLVHGGLEGNRSFDDQRNEDHVLRLRDVGPDGAKVKRKDPLLPDEGTFAWAEKWCGPESVIYGHAVHSLERYRLDTPREGVCCYGIDTGCAFGGHLTALILENLSGGTIIRTAKVRAHGSYAKWRGPKLDD